MFESKANHRRMDWPKGRKWTFPTESIDRPILNKWPLSNAVNRWRRHDRFFSLRFKNAVRQIRWVEPSFRNDSQVRKRFFPLASPRPNSIGTQVKKRTYWKALTTMTNVVSGYQNNTLGYFNTGRVVTSCKANANTLGLPYGRGHRIGIYVTHFGQHLSTVLIFCDQSPIATRWFADVSHLFVFIPSVLQVSFRAESRELSAHHHAFWVGFSRLGPLAWDYQSTSPNRWGASLFPSRGKFFLISISQIPVSRWILGPTATYNSRSASFENRSKLEDLPIQSPIPLGKSFQCFTVTQEEVSPTDGKGASVGLTTFSVSSHLAFHRNRKIVFPFV